ncbi:hypothetical protein CCMA1212_008228 [Trichoderma ghanense]|uniref:Uncharacterized protein n=1 Tax=Trichoderma ghanense TaxID=65468 RepID=A0ABY2GZ31_9HYPO
MEDTVDDENAADYDDTCTLGMMQPGMPEYSQYLKRYDGWRPEFRVDFAGGPGGFARGWPSKGGSHALSHCFGVELGRR